MSFYEKIIQFMISKELREKYIEFFKSKGHKEIPSASLVPENDSTVLFTTAGMHPLVPYLMGENHPAGKRIVNIQKCVRTGDIDDVGDSTHNTFFEMLGNWSLGDYFKEDSIKWSWEFLTDKKWLGIDPERIKVTVFEGDNDAPRDKESIKVWQECFEKSGISVEVYDKQKKNNETARIFPLPKKDNWWGPAGDEGACGSDTEIFIDLEKPVNFEKCPSNSNCKPGCSCGRYVEIWNNVFMDKKGLRIVELKEKSTGKIIELPKREYDFFEDEEREKYEFLGNNIKILESLPNKNVDTGMGLERTLAVLNGFDNVYETDVLAPIIEKIERLTLKPSETEEEFLNSGTNYENNPKAFRIIADHIRTSVFMISDGVIPSNLERGYVLRRLIRRAIRYAKMIKIKESHFTFLIAKEIIDIYKDRYPTLKENNELIQEEMVKEEERFVKALKRGLKIFNDIEEDIKNIEFLLRNPSKENMHLLEFRYSIEQYLVITDSLKEIFKYYDINLKSKISPIVPINKQDHSEIKTDDKFVDFIKSKSKMALKSITVNGKTVFNLYQSYGFPIEMIEELTKEKGWSVDEEGFNEELKKHQQLSRTASAGKFKGGLADTGEETVKLHTVAHLLLESLRRVLGDHIFQKGSNINAERLRFDFSHSEKLTDEEKQKVEDLVNKQIQKKLAVNCEEMSLKEAKKINAMGVFENKYGEKVKVYTIGKGDNIFSKEICGGPHIKNTSELGKFRIKKEQSSSSGVRRIKAVLE